MIELPSNFVANLIASANTQIANFSPLLIMLMGLAVALLAIGALIVMVRPK